MEKLTNTHKRKAWVIYFPQFDKYYPYVGRSKDSFTYDLVGVEKAHVFSKLPMANNVLKLYYNFDIFCHIDPKTRAKTSEPNNSLLVEDLAISPERTNYPCCNNSVAAFERVKANTIPKDKYSERYWTYDSSKSVVPDPYNTTLEIELIEFEIHIPVK